MADPLRPSGPQIPGSLMGEIQSEVAVEATPLLSFVLRNSRIIVTCIVLLVLVIAGVGGWQWHQTRVEREAHLELGRILVSTQGPDRIAALETFLPAAPSAMKSGVQLEIATTALGLEQYGKAAEAYAAVAAADPKGSIGMMAAIPAGMDAELTYQLIDSYVLDCERAATVPEIDRLQLSAAMDFCRRLGELRLPAGISREVYTCMSYIRNHVNTPLSLDDVAASIGRSVSYTGNLFKKETGQTLGNYIAECRLEEAKSLLYYTDMTLAEISSYLCFSSQSYFQNVFKKEYGVTPMQYRRQHHTES